MARGAVAGVGGGFLLIESQVLLKAKARAGWSLPIVPVKVLDAPNLTGQMICSVLDWSSLGTLAVGLPDDVYTLPNAAAQSPGVVTKIPPPHGVSGPLAIRWNPNVSTHSANRSMQLHV